MKCEHKASLNYDYQCILERNHQGYHKYLINGKEALIHGCCPDGQIVKYESE